MSNTSARGILVEKQRQ